jgi:DNA invertase Pin-like site-specific DNA recombinase
MIFAYVRVSSKEQNESRQIKALTEYCKELKEKNIFIDKQSGKNFERESYQELKSRLREGDTLLIKELDRLGRNKEMIKEELEYFKNIKIRMKILNIPTTLMELPKENQWVFDMINNILIEVLSAIAEEERNKIKTRQAEGIEIAKAEGKYKGRQQSELPKDFEKLYKQWKNEKINAIQFTKLLGLKSRTTLYKYVKRYETKKES